MWAGGLKDTETESMCEVREKEDFRIASGSGANGSIIKICNIRRGRFGKKYGEFSSGLIKDMHPKFRYTLKS